MATGLYDDIIAPKSTGLFDDLIRDESDPVEEKIASLKAGLAESQAASKSATRKATAYAIAANAIDIPGLIKGLINQPNRLAGLSDMGPLVSTDQIKKAASFLNPLPPSLMPQDEVSQQLMEGAAETASGLTAPENVLAAVAAKRFPTPVSTYFAGETLGAIPESTQRVLEAKSLPEAARALVPAAANVAGTGLLGQHLAGPMELPKLSPLLDALTGELTDEQIAQLRGNATRLEDLNASLPESQLTARTGPNPIIRVPAAPPLNGNGVAVQPPPAPPVVKPAPSVLDVADGPKVELPPAKGPSPRALPQVGETVQFEGEGDAMHSGRVVDLRVDEDQQVTPIVQTKDGLVALPDWQSGERIKPVKVEGPEKKADPIQFATIRMPNGDVRKEQFHPLIKPIKAEAPKAEATPKAVEAAPQASTEIAAPEVAPVVELPNVPPPMLDKPESVLDLVNERKAQGKSTFLRLSNSAKDLENPDYVSKIQKRIPDATHEIGMSTLPLWSPDKSVTAASFSDHPPGSPEYVAGAFSNFSPLIPDKRGQHAWLLEGDLVGFGYDGDPLLKNVRKIADVSHGTAADFYEQWAKSESPETIRKVAEKAAQIRATKDARRQPPKVEPEPAKVPEPTTEPSAKAETTQAEPWQMTRDEYTKQEGGEVPPIETQALDAISNRNNRKPYNPDLITPEAVAFLKKAGLIKGTKNLQLTPIGIDSIYTQRKLNKEADLKRGDAWDNHPEIVEKAVSEGKPVPPEVLADYPDLSPKPKPTPSQAEVSKAEPKLTGHGKLSKEFDDLIRENGLQLGWVTNPDALYAQIGDASSTASIKAKIAQGKAMAVARQNAARDMGLNPTDVDTMQGRAKMLEALKQHVKEHMGADTLDSAVAPKGGSEFLPESKPASESVKPAMFYATSDITGPVEVVRDFVGSPNVWEVRLKDGTLMEVESFRMKRLISGFDDKLIASAKQRTQPVKPTGELFAPKEMPFNLTGEAVKPTEAKTGFGNDTMAQQEMFAIQKITELKDPAKSADAAQQIHGSPDAAAKALRRQLAVVDSDPVTKKAFAKEQRTRLQAVIQLLQQRANKSGAKWTSATDEGGLGGQMLMGIPDPIKTYKAAVALTKAGIKALTPAARASAEAIRNVAHEVINSGKMTDYRRSVLNWSAKLQRSFGEASEAQRDIMKRVPNESRRDGITNWIQANGDAAVLTARRDATTNPKLRAGYDAALTLTPEETAAAQEVRGAYNALGLRGEHYDVLKSFKDNYVTQIWNLRNSPGAGGGGSRTLKERFKFSRASTFPTFFDGEQAGFVPKTKDIAKLLPVYLHEMNSVIAARQLVQELSKGVASDGRPLVAARGTGIPVNDATGKATLVMPKVSKGDTGDYKTLENQPALHDWRWAAKDDAGNPIFLKADLALHPEAYNRIKAVLGKSAIREWFNTPTSATAAIPKAIVKGIDMAQSETKRTMLGLIAPFHQVQEGFHGFGHKVNPTFSIPKIDLVNDAGQMDAARHGLMLLPDRASEGQFMEGFKTSGLVSRIPVLGPISDFYSNYLFHEYIPGVKYKTYQAILQRNQKVFAKDVASGKVKLEEVKALSAEQANAAYGHLNYADLGRNPTIQHLAQLFLLAPDFLEARGRFAGQALRGLTGAKVGREQIIALATLAVAQATLAWIGAKTTGGDWDHKRPFEFRNGTRKYTMRSVPEDIYGLITQTRQFVNSRLAPLTQSLEQFRSGVDWRGQKVTAGETAKEMLAKPIPLTVRELPGLRHLTGSDRPGNVTPLEQLAGALGLRISRANPREDLNTQHAEWLKNNKDPRVRADYERNAKATYPTSKYKEVDSRLADRDDKAAMEALQALRQQEGGNQAADNRIFKRFQKASVSPVFHESWAHENAFKATLTPEQVKLYDAAKKERQATFERFLALWAKRNGKG